MSRRASGDIRPECDIGLHFALSFDFDLGLDTWMAFTYVNIWSTKLAKIGNRVCKPMSPTSLWMSHNWCARVGPTVVYQRETTIRERAISQPTALSAR